MRLPPIYITDAEINPAPWERFAGLQRGGIVLVRDYDHPERAEYAARIVAEARRHGLYVYIAGDAALARVIGADGLHLPERMLARFPKRIFARRGFRITAAAHDLHAILRASRHPRADAILLSPIFETETHPGRPALGPVRFSALARKARQPVYALGGLNSANFRRILGSGASGISRKSSWLA